MSEPAPSASTSDTGDRDACNAAGEPGAPHEVLGAFAGKWNAAVQFWPAPGAPPIEAEGTMESSWILGERFLQQDYRSNFMGSPFNGCGLFGFNNVDERYEGVWADTMSTAMMTESGKFDPDTKTFTMLGTVTEPQSKKIMRKKTLITIDGPDQHTMSMHFSEEGATEFWKCMEIVYTRA